MIEREDICNEIRRIARGMAHHNDDTVWVDKSETMFDALGHLYEKLDGGDLQYAIDLEEELEKEKKAREDKLILEPPKKNAVDRAVEMMRIKQSELPPLALGFARHLGRQLGMCGEVYITAFAAYAQAIEKLPCDDDLYTLRADAQQWFDEHSKAAT